MTETVSSPPRSGATPPQPPRPVIPGPLETAVLAWRWLRKMSTALLLLFALSIASLIATVVPQQPVNAATVEQWRSGAAGPGESVAGVLDALQLFDVFGSWWFAAITVALFVSLTGCLVPRYRAFFRLVRRPPAVGRNLDRLTHSRTVTTTLPPAEALDVAERLLAGRRFRRRRIAPDDGAAAQIAAERGHWREGGSLIFHTAFYVLLIGAVIGQVFGFTGQIAVVEGGSFADTRIAYDSVKPGRWFGVEDHRGFVTTLDDFEVTYHPNLTPRAFVSTVTLAEGGRPVRTADVKVNHPLRHAGMTLYQLAFGLAPHIIVRSGDQVLLDEPVLLSPAEGPRAGNVWTGTAKLRFEDPERQLALDMVLVPDAELRDGQPTVGRDPRPVNPVLVSNLYFGDLGLERPVPANQFDRSGGPAQTAMLRPGDTAELVRGAMTVELTDITYWSGFQVSRQPGRWLLLLAAALILMGLIPSLYSYRRRIWVEARPVATPSAGTSEVRVAGVALHRKTIFGDAFDSLADDLRTALPAPTAQEPD